MSNLDDFEGQIIITSDNKIIKSDDFRYLIVLAMKKISEFPLSLDKFMINENDWQDIVKYNDDQLGD